MRHLSFRVAHSGSQQKTVHVCSALHRQLNSGVFSGGGSGSASDHLATRKLPHRLLQGAQRPLDNDDRGRELRQRRFAGESVNSGGSRRVSLPVGGTALPPVRFSAAGQRASGGWDQLEGQLLLTRRLGREEPERRSGRSSRDPRRGAPTARERRRSASARRRRRRRRRQKQSRWWRSSGSGWPTRSTAKTSRSVATWPRPRETPPRRKHRWDRGCWRCSSSWSAVRRSSRLFRVSGWACERVGL